MSSTVDVVIESLGGLGDGITSVRGKPLFVSKSTVGDRLRVRIVHETKETMRGDIAEILEHGPNRRSAPCPHFDDCGGCMLQHLTDDAYRKFKQQILANAIRVAGFDLGSEVIFPPAEGRRRVELKLEHRDKGIALAYYAQRSHTLVPVDNCLILAPALHQILAPLTAALGRWEPISAIHSLTLTAADSGIDLSLHYKNDKPKTDGLTAIAEQLNLARISLKDEIVVERTPVTMRFGNQDVPIPPNVFLQATSEAQTTITDAILKATQGARSIVDLFCGIGTYSYPLAAHAAVHAIEGDASMVQSLKDSAKKSGFKLTAEKRDLFKNPLAASELKRFDAAVINPPRLGAKAQSEAIAASTLKTVVMVSCNPATWSRDAKILKNAGFALESAFGIDQFVYSPHLEIVSIFKR